jgi:large subunit ribosomal protein L21
MYAIIKTGNKQYRVKEGDIIDVEKLPGEENGAIKFEEVLLLSTGNAIKVGAPLLAGAFVKGEIVKQFRDDKIYVFKYKKRKNCRRGRGHRQNLSRVKITGIEGGK